MIALSSATSPWHVIIKVTPLKAPDHRELHQDSGSCCVTARLSVFSLDKDALKENPECDNEAEHIRPKAVS